MQIRNPLDFIIVMVLLLCAKIGGWNTLFLFIALLIGLGIWIGRLISG